MNTNIVTYCEKPINLKLVIDGTINEIIPSFWILYKNGKEEIQQVEYSKELINNGIINLKTSKKSLLIEQWCNKNSYNFTLRTEKDIDSGIFYINNLRYLYGIIKRQDCPLCSKYLKILKNKLYADSIKIDDLIKSNVIPGDIIYSIIALGIYEGTLDAAITNEILCLNTEVWNHREKEY